MGDVEFHAADELFAGPFDGVVEHGGLFCFAGQDTFTQVDDSYEIEQYAYDTDTFEEAGDGAGEVVNKPYMNQFHKAFHHFGEEEREDDDSDEDDEKSHEECAVASESDECREPMGETHGEDASHDNAGQRSQLENQSPFIAFKDEVTQWYGDKQIKEIHDKISVFGLQKYIFFWYVKKKGYICCSIHVLMFLVRKTQSSSYR